MGLGALGRHTLLAVDHDLALAFRRTRLHGTPQAAAFAHRLGRRIDKHAHHALIGAPVAAAHGVLEVNILAVALTLDDIAQTGLHAALCGGGV